ncbi:MAG TPA: hypothetical protein VNY73_00730 [Bacteroidia bacterium]|jgi:hypothetical protein|nr:hypothetical protein [Bacteroidia bacterium]
MKRLIFILLAGALSFSTVTAQDFGGNSMSKRHKSMGSKPKKHKAKKKKKKKDKDDK